jgi:hypothetical protein
MTIEATILTSYPAGIAKKIWTTPHIEVLDINAAEGSQVGPLCDKFGSLSFTTGNDRCDPATK